MRRLFTAVATVAMAAGTVTALSLPATASPDTTSPAVSPTVSPAVSTMVDAMRRDLGLTAEQAEARIASVVPAATTQARLRDRLGAGFGGAWMSADGRRLTVGVTDPAASASVRAAGALPVVVARSSATLDKIKLGLDGVAARASSQVYGWYVDQPGNTVVVRARTAAAAAAFVAASGVDAAAVRVVTSATAPRLMADYRNVRGGEAFSSPSGPCSIGFAVVGGYVTAGHCGATGDYVTGYDGEAQGQFMGSSVPVDDYGWVQTNVIWVPQGVVYNWGPSYQGVTPVDGSLAAPVGTAVCRSGITTGWRCGQVLALNQTVNYPGGAVFGLTTTSACADNGDSGGSVLAGRQAQGVLSGGIGNCNGGFAESYFQPVNEILTQYGLTLITTATPLGLHDLACQVTPGGRFATYRCEVTYNGGSPGYTHTWTLSGAPPFQAGTVVSGVCRRPNGYDVQVVVRDSLGRTLTATTGFGCP